MAFESEDQSIFCAVLFLFRMYYQNEGLEELDLNAGRRHFSFCFFAVKRCSFSHVALGMYSPNLVSDCSLLEEEKKINTKTSFVYGFGL